MFVRDVLLYKGCGLEKLLTRFTTEFAFILLLDILLNSLAQLPAAPSASNITIA
jgi:hypothetical protein